MRNVCLCVCCILVFPLLSHILSLRFSPSIFMTVSCESRPWKLFFLGLQLFLKGVEKFLLSEWSNSELSHVVKPEPRSDQRDYHIHIQSIVCVGFVAKTVPTWALKSCWTSPVLLWDSCCTEQSVHTAVGQTTSEVSSRVSVTFVLNTHWSHTVTLFTTQGRSKSFNRDVSSWFQSYLDEKRKDLGDEVAQP